MQHKKKPAKRSILTRVFRFFMKLFLYGFLFSILYILFCKWINPPITITQLNSVLRGYGLQRDYVDINNMSPNIKLAVMSAEDQIFPDHNGFDFKSIEKAMKHNRKSKSLRGASTISQQVAKNVFLWQHGGYCTLLTAVGLGTWLFTKAGTEYYASPSLVIGGAALASIGYLLLKSNNSSYSIGKKYRLDYIKVK